MKRHLIALAAFAFASPALAADLPPVDVVDSVEAYQFFVAGKIGAGPSLIDNDFRTVTAGDQAAASEGRFEDDWIAGIGVEAGMFLTDNIRISAQFNAGRIEHDQEVLTGGPTFDGLTVVGASPAFGLDGHTKVYQGFAKIGYETRLVDLGFTSPIFERSSIFATAGVGFTHLRSKASLDLTSIGAGLGNVNRRDTVLSGQVGFGGAYALTDRIDFVTETNFTFGGDADLGFTLAGGAVEAVTVAETAAITSQLGLRFKF